MIENPVDSQSEVSVVSLDYGILPTWPQIQKAIHAWVSSASGSTTIWAKQNSPRPSGRYLALQVRSMEPTGFGWNTVEDLGSSIRNRSQNSYRAILRITAFAGDGVGASAPANVLLKVLQKRRLPSFSEDLQAVGVGFGVAGALTEVDSFWSELIEPQAYVEIPIFFAAEESETADYIQTVEITNELTDVTQTVDLNDEP